MNTAVRLPLSAANPSVVKDLQKKYPTAEMHIVTNDAAAGEAPAMNEERFWDIISLLDWSKEGSEEVLAPAIGALAKCTEADIRQFSELLARKLYDLDGERFARELAPGDAYTDNESHFSVDVFLYARCLVIANGREFFEKVLIDPTLMPKGYDFEPLLSLPAAAWELKTGKDDYVQCTEYWYETFNNPEGWPGITPLKDRILGTHE